ncbi:MAG: hypothetical protein K5770_14085 [Lachnospiraceae bacterium]|nr:hypothetical protein [Lachnospiraceae bacterium]
MAYAVGSWSLLLFIYTEVLSLFKGITESGLFKVWILTDCILILGVYYAINKRKLKLNEISNLWRRSVSEYKDLPTGYKVAYLLISLSFLAVIILNRITVPYNWDSMSYHLPRIMFWAQNHSVAHFATEDARQLSSPFLAEFVNLHLYVLNGNDRCFNLLQGVSYCFNAVSVYAISKSLGLNRKWSILAEVLFMSAPIVFSEALTTQVDQFAAVWMVIFAYIAISLTDREHIDLSDRECIADIIMLGANAGFGYITKPSVCIAMVIFSVGLLIARIKAHDRISVILSAPVIVGIVALFIILPEIIRNIYTFGAFSTSDVGAQQLVGTLSPRYLLVNFVKNIAFTLPNVYVPEISGYLYRFVTFFAGSLRVDINDRSISERGMEYAMNAADDIGHDTAINAIIVSLFLVVIIIAAIRWLITRRRVFNNYCWCSVISYIAFMFVLRWEPYETRYQISYLALLCPFIAFCLNSFSDSSQHREITFFSIIMFLCICSFLDLETRHFAKYKTEAGVRPAGYFAANKIYREWTAVTSLVNMKKYSDIGFKTDNYHYSYPIWPMCDSVKRIEYIVNEDIASAKYEDRTFKPQAVLWFGELENETIEWHGAEYKTIYSRGDYYLLENKDFKDDPATEYIMLEDNAEAYLESLAKTDYTVFISAGETAVNQISDELKSGLYLLGVQSDLSDPEANSFYAVLKGGNSIREKYGPESIGTVGRFDQNHRYILTSAGKDVEGYNSVEIDGFDFLQKINGISIVTYDDDMDQVVDSVTIDTGSDSRSVLRTGYLQEVD